MEAKLEQHRGEIEGYMTEWKNHVQSHFIKLAREGPKVGKKILQSTLIAHDKKSDPFTKLSDDVKRLLRADSFFSTTSQFGSDRSLTYGSILKVEGLIGAHKSTLPVVARAPPSLDQVRWHAEAHKAARELLRSMGRPNASYLEMTGKSIYSCGRCHDTGAKTWEQMVQHYVQEKQTHARIQEDIRSANSNVTYNNIHDPKLRTKQPLVRYSGAKATNESEPFECRVCPESPILQEVITSEAQVLKHLLDVHGIAKPEPEEHYGPQITEESEWYESGYYDSDDGFGLFGGDFSDDGISEGGGCAYARRRLAGYAALVACITLVMMIGGEALRKNPNQRLTKNAYYKTARA
ncbi:hypothetical protein FRC11_013439 [Ceratobasidium sp. 423]|nr:hypothetical protein FRC11_013439 [Ceratobasidium sp. 423]